MLLKRYGRGPETTKLDVKKLAAAAVDFTGAEIENVIIAAMFDRFAIDGKDITTTNLLDEINSTQPLAKMAAADIALMREKGEGKLKVATSSGAVRSIEAGKPASGRNVELSL